jgi:putative ABC transport system ATP-binding protein
MPELENPAVRDTFRRAYAHLPGARSGLGVTAGFAFVGAFSRVILPIVLRAVIDHGIGHGVDHGSTVAHVRVRLIAVLCALGFSALVITEIATRIAAWRLGRWSESMMAELRRRCVDRFLDMSLDQHARAKRGVLVARATTDVESISRFFEWGAIAWLVNTAILLILAVYLLALDARLGVIALAVTFPMAFVIRFVQKRLLHAYGAVREQVGIYLGRTSEIVSGAAVIRAYGANDLMRRSAAQAIDGRRRAQVRANALSATLFPLGDLFASVAITTIVVVGLRMAAHSTLSDGTLVALVFATLRIVDPVGELAENVDQTQLAIAGLARIVDLLDLPVELAADADAVVLPPGPLAVSFDGVSYRYPARRRDDVDDGRGTGAETSASSTDSGSADDDDDSLLVYDDGAEPNPWALNDVSFDVASGTSLALVGATGSGKSTAARLLVRMSDPQEGTLRVQNIDLRRIEETSLRSRVQLVPQEPFLFDQTIAENLRAGRPAASDADLHAALARLGLGDWVAALPDGLAPRGGERGWVQSAGERQLVALIRAEVMDPDVLVLDEATSSVDAATEARLADTIDRIALGRTMVVIAHRLSTAARCDRIAVLHHGRLVELGTHDDLVQARGRYASSLADWSAGVHA